MFAVALYSGQFQGIDAQMERFLRLVSFVVTTPVVFYSARPFFAGAIRGLRARQPGMDLPVSIAVGTAYVASVYATYTNGPQVWYDSVTMFVFFLTVGRYLEMRARHRSIDRSAAMSGLLPNTVKVRTVLEEGEMNRRALTFEIRGQLWAHPLPLELFLKTEVDLETGNVDVYESGG